MSAAPGAALGAAAPAIPGQSPRARAAAGGSGVGRGAETPRWLCFRHLFPPTPDHEAAGPEVGLLELRDCLLPCSPRTSVRSVQTGQLLTDELI